VIQVKVANAHALSTRFPKLRCRELNRDLERIQIALNQKPDADSVDPVVFTAQPVPHAASRSNMEPVERSYGLHQPVAFMAAPKLRWDRLSSCKNKR